MAIFAPSFMAAPAGRRQPRNNSAAPADEPVGRDYPIRTILIASSNPKERQTWAEYLAHPQHRILSASDGQAALRGIHANHPDLVVAAMSMARLDGLELLRVIHETEPRLRVILITKGHSDIDRSYKKLAMLLGASAIFSQPLDAEELLLGVRTALELDSPPP
jgi:DNA-binding NtrC family response regulator